MNDSIDTIPSLDSLVDLAKSEKLFLNTFIALSTFPENSPETSASDLTEATGIDYYDIVAAFKTFEELGIGRFLVGRHGGETRMRWFISPSKLGKQVLYALEHGVSANAANPQTQPQIQNQTLLLRKDFAIEVILPLDFNSTDAIRLANWLSSLAMD